MAKIGTGQFEYSRQLRTLMMPEVMAAIGDSFAGHWKDSDNVIAERAAVWLSLKCLSRRVLPSMLKRNRHRRQSALEVPSSLIMEPSPSGWAIAITS